MLDIAWPELIVIGAVALVAIGPKDLPKVMRTMGQWAAKARGVMQDIHRSFEQLNYETEIAEKLQKEEQAQQPQHSEAHFEPPAGEAAPVMTEKPRDTSHDPKIL
jgi:sec-independent protein translocase protein TatB